MKNTRVLLASRPQGAIKPTDFKVIQEELPELEDHQVLIKQEYMSLDPAVRGWMDADFASYIEPIQIGETMRSLGFGVVEKSNHPDFATGTKVSGFLGWSEFVISNGEGLSIIPDQMPLELCAGVLGLPGTTAYHGLMELVGKPQAGQTLLVSGAAGSVGSIVGQIAKAEGLRVIGVTGSEEKRQWLLNELGFDAVINYKTDNIQQKLAEYAPNGIDRHFENVGGEVLQAAIDHMNPHGKISMCGLISTYNNTERATGPDLMPLIAKRIHMQGFVMLDQMHRMDELAQHLSGYLEKGQIKFRLDIVQGLEQAPVAVNKLFDGSNQGKLVVKL